MIRLRHMLTHIKILYEIDCILCHQQIVHDTFPCQVNSDIHPVRITVYTIIDNTYSQWRIQEFMNGEGAHGRGSSKKEVALLVGIFAK